MPELAMRNIEHDAAVDLRPVGVVRQKNEFHFGIDKLLDQPRTRHPIDFDLLSRDPFHGLGSEWEISSKACGPRFFIHRSRSNGVFNGDTGAVKDEDFVVGRAAGFFPGNDFA